MLTAMLTGSQSNTVNFLQACESYLVSVGCTVPTACLFSSHSPSEWCPLYRQRQSNTEEQTDRERERRGGAERWVISSAVPWLCVCLCVCMHCQTGYTGTKGHQRRVVVADDQLSLIWYLSLSLSNTHAEEVRLQLLDVSADRYGSAANFLLNTWMITSTRQEAFKRSFVWCAWNIFPSQCFYQK